MLSNTRKFVDVVAAVIRRDGQVLAVRRPEGKPMAGYWEFPGGKVEAGESLAEALVRELDEELGIRPEAFDLWREKRHIYEDISVNLHFFIVDAFQGAPSSREGQELAWFRPGASFALEFLPADKEIVELIGRLEK